MAGPAAVPGAAGAAPAVVAAADTTSPTHTPSADAATDADADAATALAVAPCRPVAVICVQLSTESAWVRGGPGPVPVRVGRANSPTPVGLFAVAVKRLDHVSGLDGTPMPFAVFFAGDVAYYEGDVTEPSAGSVRLPSEAGEAFFDAVEEGDAVQVVP